MWNMNQLYLCTDSLTAYHWVSDTLTGRARVKTKASSEMLIRRRLGTLKSLIEVYKLELKVTLVTSGCNIADARTHVPQKWLKMVNESQEVCGATADSLTANQIAEIHHGTGHCGISVYVIFDTVHHEEFDSEEKTGNESSFVCHFDEKPSKTAENRRK